MLKMATGNISAPSAYFWPGLTKRISLRLNGATTKLVNRKSRSLLSG